MQRFTVKVQLAFFLPYLFLVHWHHKNNHPGEGCSLLYSNLEAPVEFRIFATLSAECLAFDAIIVTPCTVYATLIIREHACAEPHTYSVIFIPCTTSNL